MEHLKEKLIRVLPLDLTDEASLEACYRSIDTEVGGIDILVNNTGYGNYGSIEEMPLDAARRQFEVNLFGLGRITQLAIPHMRSKRPGLIINVSSIGGSGAYTEHKRTFFIWEAVTQYLTETGIGATLDFLAAAPQSSRLAFTYVLKDFLDGQDLCGQERLHERYVKSNIWLFGLDPRNASDFLDPCGWRVTEHLGCEELAER